MTPDIYDLSWNDMTESELAGHRLTIDDAFEVLDDAPRHFRQRPKSQLRPDDAIVERPARLRMVGWTVQGRLLTFIIEYPDDAGRSHVVTGWPADDEERARYGQARGGRA